MLQRGIESDTLPWCREHGVSVLVYWPLMKGLFAGKIRPEKLHDRDNRQKYPQFQGEELQKNLELVEKLRSIAQDAGHTVVELAINWILRTPGITSAVCGAKRPDQISENAGGSGWELSEPELAAIEEALKQRGGKGAVGGVKDRRRIGDFSSADWELAVSGRQPYKIEILR